MNRTFFIIFITLIILQTSNISTNTSLNLYDHIRILDVSNSVILNNTIDKTSDINNSSNIEIKSTNDTSNSNNQNQSNAELNDLLKTNNENTQTPNMNNLKNDVDNHVPKTSFESQIYLSKLTAKQREDYFYWIKYKNSFFNNEQQMTSVIL